MKEDNNPMNDQMLARRWFDGAKSQLESARLLYDEMRPQPLGIICYHCQQAAEKSLRTYLCANGVGPVKTHDMELLCRCCCEFEPGFAEFLAACKALEIYESGTRYPGGVVVTEQDAGRALEQAAVIYDAVFDKIEKLFEEEDIEPGGMEMQ